MSHCDALFSEVLEHMTIINRTRVSGLFYEQLWGLPVGTSAQIIMRGLPGSEGGRTLVVEAGIGMHGVKECTVVDNVQHTPLWSTQEICFCRGKLNTTYVHRSNADENKFHYQHMTLYHRKNNFPFIK